MEKCILSGWIGACTPIWRPLLRLTTATPPHAFPLLHFLSCFNIHHRLHLAFLGHSFDITFPLQIFNYFPTDHQVNFKFLNSEFNDFQNGTHLQLHPLLIPPLTGHSTDHPVHTSTCPHVPGWAGASLLHSWLLHVSTEISVSFSSLGPQKKKTFHNI